MLFNLNDEARIIGISGMIGSGKTILAKELARDEEVRGNQFCPLLCLKLSIVNMLGPSLKSFEQFMLLLSGMFTGLFG